MSALDGKVTISNSEYRLCRVDGEKALFHKWNDFSNVVKASPLIDGAPAGENQIHIRDCRIRGWKCKGSCTT